MVMELLQMGVHLVALEAFFPMSRDCQTSEFTMSISIEVL
jgi:hypothetical protein